jgi:hypothetical protein
MTAHAVVSITIAQSATTVFDAVQDYGIRLDWDTMLRRADIVDGQAVGKGVVAVCSARWYLGGFVFRTRYVSFSRPTLAAVTLVKPYFVFDMWSASIRHRDLPAAQSESARSEVTYTVSLRCRPRWLARPSEAVAIALFRRETKRRLVALKRYLESAPAQGGVAHPRPEIDPCW